MDELHRDLARHGLNALRSATGASSLTCHFLNPYSGYYWLFHKDGDFRYPWQMNGPVTHPDQTIRFEYGSIEAKPDCQEDSDGITIMPSIPTAISDRLLGGPSFAQREQIDGSVRIHIGNWAADEPEPQVFIFLNYKRGTPLHVGDARATILQYLPSHGKILHHLAGQPRLDE